ncbi:MAG: hypothetical protein JNK82_35995 [Myxococcaceae bacterium]|nr:hypothetical protein [Myxococcaceae bacterium]
MPKGVRFDEVCVELFGDSFDCACTGKCNELHLSKRVQGLQAFHADCLRALPSCQ